MSEEKKEFVESPFTMALLAGACAGVSVDVSLYPIDTIKTRCQAQEGFFKAGGFTGIYRGLGAAALGSAPGAALFFSTYETVKPLARSALGDDRPVAVQGFAASSGECMACLVRVPTEVVKQRMQAGQYTSLSGGARQLMSTEGIAGFYRGYFTTITREIPFALIQFPLWERMKKECAEWQGHETSAWQGALFGSASGAFAAAVTTPLDVAKTRIMLGQSEAGFVGTIANVYKNEGARACFAGVEPRTFWIGLGGFVFFGAYEKATEVFRKSGLWYEKSGLWD
jgi:solute carrier family 25 S-adenosylmethionine transporter 26